MPVTVLTKPQYHISTFDNISAIMKIFQTLFISGAALFVASQAYVVELYGSTDCTGGSTRRNVWDNTCAYTDGFRSLRLKKNGGTFQQLTAYSRQACAGTTTLQGCASGVNSLPIDNCVRTSGGSNALSSYSSGGPCPR